MSGYRQVVSLAPPERAISCRRLSGRGFVPAALLALLCGAGLVHLGPMPSATLAPWHEAIELRRGMLPADVEQQLGRWLGAAADAEIAPGELREMRLRLPAHRGVRCDLRLWFAGGGEGLQAAELRGRRSGMIWFEPVRLQPF